MRGNLAALLSVTALLSLGLALAPGAQAIVYDASIKGVLQMESSIHPEKQLNIEAVLLDGEFAVGYASVCPPPFAQLDRRCLGGYVMELVPPAGLESWWCVSGPNIQDSGATNFRFLIYDLGSGALGFDAYQVASGDVSCDSSWCRNPDTCGARGTAGDMRTFNPGI